MDNNFELAVNWALQQQQYEIEEGVFIPVSKEMPFTVVDKVRKYFNINNIEYSSFSFDDLIPYLPN